MAGFKVWAARIGVVVIVAVLAALATALWVHTAPMRAPAPKLTAGLSGSWSEVSVAFDARVRARYPIGLSEASFGADLAAQGFHRLDWSSSPADEHEAGRVQNGFVCRQAFNVYWRVDASRRLTSVRGEHPAPVCA